MSLRRTSVRYGDANAATVSIIDNRQPRFCQSISIKGRGISNSNIH